MRKITTTRQLARALGEVAREVAVEHGDQAAQAAVYSQFLRRLDRTLADTIYSPADRATASRVECVLDAADFDLVFDAYRSEGKDPAVYFFEEFTAECDPDGSRRRGVRYSPPAVVSYMVRGVDSILRTRFGCTLADAVVLDPCCGIGTFLRHIETRCPRPARAIGMELMPAACELAGRLLCWSRVVCADALACASGLPTVFDPMFPERSESERPAGEPLVVIGNPPYSGHSANTPRLRSLTVDYRAGLGERNPKWLQDDYVRFIRIAQHWVETAGRGIVAFITNHSFLVNPTFRAMRQSLMRSFDELYLLDLQGNLRLLKRASGDEPDENVFDIRTGVAISFMVNLGRRVAGPGPAKDPVLAPQEKFKSCAAQDSLKEASGKNLCRVFHAEICGTREHKLRALSEMDFGTTPWTRLQPAAPLLLFTPRGRDLREEYSGFVSLLDIFSETSVGFVTSRDAFAIAFTRQELLERIAHLRDDRISPDYIRAKYPIGDLDVESARRLLQADPHWQDRAVRVLYRPFDWRWGYLSRAVMERPRIPFMDSLVAENITGKGQDGRGPDIALVVGRAGQATGSNEWDVVYCADCPTDLNVFRRGGAMLFPRWLVRGGHRLSNVRTVGRDADAVVRYIYAILHSAEYRARYRDFLMIDFPRIPFAGDDDAFSALARLGAQLIATHTLAAEETSSTADSPKDNNPESRLRIGGYDIPGRFLHDRRHRDLTHEERLHVGRIVQAVHRTDRIRGEIDEIIRAKPPWGRLMRTCFCEEEHTAHLDGRPG
ncbi:MAG: type ISP restriction/modification enzyme [Armatimonadota bacterium]